MHQSVDLVFCCDLNAKNCRKEILLHFLESGSSCNRLREEPCFCFSKGYSSKDKKCFNRDSIVINKKLKPEKDKKTWSISIASQKVNVIFKSVVSRELLNVFALFGFEWSRRPGNDP